MNENLFIYLQLEDKESEIQRLKNEVCATQAILANLQRKVQEAKQIARSPSRSSPENHQVSIVSLFAVKSNKAKLEGMDDFCKMLL